MTERQLRNKIEKLVAYQFQGDPEVKHVISAQEIYDILSEYIAKHDRELVEKILEEIDSEFGDWGMIDWSGTKEKVRSKFLGGES